MALRSRADQRRSQRVQARVVAGLLVSDCCHESMLLCRPILASHSSTRHFAIGNAQWLEFLFDYGALLGSPLRSVHSTFVGSKESRVVAANGRLLIWHQADEKEGVIGAGRFLNAVQSAASLGTLIISLAVRETPSGKSVLSLSHGDRYQLFDLVCIVRCLLSDIRTGL